MSNLQLKTGRTFYRNVLMFLVSLFLVLIILANYGSIIDLFADLSYIISPDKRSAENERLTSELLALYGSRPIEYYQGKRNSVVIDDNAPVQTHNVEQPIQVVTPVPEQSLVRDTASTEIQAGNYIYIPDINATAPIISGGSTDAQTILNDLKKGALMYPGSDLPGNGGSTVIIGHSSSSIPWQKYGRIFSKLPELREGGMIIVNYNERKYSYRINRIITGSINELTALNIKDDLVLGTCWPIGTNEKRIIVTATLTY